MVSPEGELFSLRAPPSITDCRTHHFAGDQRSRHAVMLVLSGFGLMHARRVSPAAEILSGHPANGQTPVPASSPANQA